MESGFSHGVLAKRRAKADIKPMERNRELDVIKAIAIVLVVAGHVVQRAMPSNAAYVASDFANVVTMLTMPVFFFVSGIAMSYRKPLDAPMFAYDLVKRLFRYLWPTLMFLYFRTWFYQQFTDVGQAWDLFFQYPTYGLWFLWVLLFSNIALDLGLYFASFFRINRKIFGFCGVLIPYVVVVCLRENGIIENDHVFGYDMFLLYVPVILAGYLAAPLFTMKVKWPALDIGLVAVGLALCVTLSILMPRYYKSQMRDILWWVYGAAVGAVIAYKGIASLICRLRIGKAVAFLGGFTLETYYLHLIVIKNWPSIRGANDFLTVLASIGMVLFLLANTAAVIAVLYWIPFGNFVFFGRSYSHYGFEKRFFADIKPAKAEQ